MPANITFRTQLLGGVTEFCNACRLPIFSNTLHLVELVVLLAKYTEEGVALYPEVYVTTDISTLVAMLPEAECLPLGSATRDATGIKHAIKKSAPLATGGWMIYLDDKGDSIHYGLFRGSSNPISVLVDNVILDKEVVVPVTKIHQVAQDCVEIINCSGERHFIFLNHRKEDSPPPLASLKSLIDSATATVPIELIDPTRAYLDRILYNALRISHGTLIAVTNKTRPPSKLFNDGITLNEPIDFPSIIRKVKRSEASIEKLNSAASLIEGMLNSDGIILFSDSAKVLGFNYFVRAKPSTKQAGGARRRAFTTLSANLDKGICGAFIQSQDGWSEFQGTRA